jgi:hypothetical protein
MELPEYLELVANQLKKSDKTETIRLIRLLIKVLEESLVKVGAEKVE